MNRVTESGSERASGTTTVSATDAADASVLPHTAVTAAEWSRLPGAEWWNRPDLGWQKDQLCFAGRTVGELARQLDKPSFWYSAARVEQNVRRLYAALDGAGFQNRCRVNYAMKANRFAPLLTFLKQTGLVGIDACSPNEVEHALSCGFSPQEICFTNTSLSRQDLDRLARIDGLRINCDSLHTIAQWGQRRPGSRIGIRINPGCGVSRAHNEKLQYSGLGTSKFGIYRQQFSEALGLAGQHGLQIDTIHFHTGCGYLNEQLETWDGILGECQWFINQVPNLRFVNIGGGMGVPHVAGDDPLDLQRWSAILRSHFGNRPELTVEMEPGDYVAKDAGILMLTVGSTERKQDTVFVGVNGGFNIAPEPVVYGLPFHPVPGIFRPGPLRRYSIAGHINEAMDVWYRDIELPPIEVDDVLVLLNAGAYSSSMASNHCMRGEFREFLLF